MISWLVIGLIVGALLGFTGGGGAIIGVPLFVWLVGVDFKSATVLSLFAVVAGALLNAWMQRRQADFRAALSFAVFSILGSQLGAVIKSWIPETGLKLLFAAICISSWVSLIRGVRKPARVLDEVPRPGLGVLAPIGVILGVLTTLTGLGGGVLLIPLMTGPLGFKMSRAAATSLWTVSMSAMLSLLSQRASLAGLLAWEPVTALILANTVSALAVQRLIASISPERMDLIRRVLISCVIALALLSLVLR